MTGGGLARPDAGAAEDVGFALSCLNGGLVSLDRFKDALVAIVERAPIDDVPACVFDMLDCTDRHDLRREVAIPHAVRFPAFLTDRRIDALIGLRLERDPTGDTLPNMPVAQAAAALAACPEVRTKFEALFGGRV